MKAIRHPVPSGERRNLFSSRFYLLVRFFSVPTTKSQTVFMRQALIFILTPVFFAFVTLPAQAQKGEVSPAYRLAQFAEGRSPADSMVREYRSALYSVSSRFPKSRSEVVDVVIQRSKELREGNLLGEIPKILGVDGLSGLPISGRSLGKMLDTYIDYRAGGLEHEGAIKKMRPH